MFNNKSNKNIFSPNIRLQSASEVININRTRSYMQINMNVHQTCTSLGIYILKHILNNIYKQNTGRFVGRILHMKKFGTLTWPRVSKINFLIHVLESFFTTAAMSLSVVLSARVKPSYRISLETYRKQFQINAFKIYNILLPF